MATATGKQKKLALITDLAGYGRCALSVQMPIISALKTQCCPIPTSFFSNHSAFPSFYMQDFTEHMTPYIDKWKELGFTFDGMCSGFLSSAAQMEIVKNFFHDFKTDTSVIIVDPVMGDHGKLYSTYTPAMCEEMKKLVTYADIITPNLTEALVLTDRAYVDKKWTGAELEQIADDLISMGPKKVVITGIAMGSYVGNYLKCAGEKGNLLRTKKVGTPRHGTGDIFASIIAADALQGVPFETSVRKASHFIQSCILTSEELQIPVIDGVCFEQVLSELIK